MSEPEWTRVRLSLDQKSVIDYIIMDAQLLSVVHIDSMDIGMSDNFLVWLELGRNGGVLIGLKSALQAEVEAWRKGE